MNVYSPDCDFGEVISGTEFYLYAKDRIRLLGEIFKSKIKSLEIYIYLKKSGSLSHCALLFSTSNKLDKNSYWFIIVNEDWQTGGQTD